MSSTARPSNSGHEPAPESGRAVAAAAFAAIGGERRVLRFHSADETHHADVLWCQGAPAPGWNTYSTLSLHRWPNVVNGTDIRVELAGVAESDVGTFSDVLVEAALLIMRDGWFAAPGVVFADLVREHVPDTTVPHLVWAPPSPWDELSSVAVPGGIDVKWLLALPVSDAERGVIVTDGFDSLEDRLAEVEVEYYDLFRESTV